MVKGSKVNTHHLVSLLGEIVANANPTGTTVTCLEPSLSLESKFSFGQLALHFLFRHPHHVSVSPPSTKQLPKKNQDNELQVMLARV